MVVPRHFALNCWTDTAVTAAGALRASAGVEWSGVDDGRACRGGQGKGRADVDRASALSEGGSEGGEQEMWRRRISG